ncbi:WD40-repeat-containing domain protein [Blastocladiella britannica]|nr:WD40-repeat-containing domain protein [Blastocladiella britannica]
MSTATAAHRSEGGSRLFGKVHPVRAMRAREVGGHAFVSSEVHVASEQDRFLPNTNGRALLEYEARPYCGQFSDDGKFFYACTQDFNVHLYDASDPLNLREYKTVTTSVGQWTITDATLSPDNQLLAHSSITPYVDIASTDPYLPDEKTTINLSHGPASTAGRRFGIWSLRFSSDGRELVAGTSSNSLVIYDLDRRSVVLSVRGHADDVNAVCFADASTHVLFSGSDDSLIKVWDRRTLRSGDAARPVGVLPGHTEGITYVASRGDGRYCVSNGKDQCAKVWDVRMCMAPDKFDALPIRERDARIDFDYRYMSYPLGKYGPSIHRHTHDASVVTLMGHHQVLSTLIRCHFAPNGAPYIATGSANGSIAIYNLQGEAMRELRAAGAAGRAAGYASYHGWRRSEVVRDVAWHPHGIPLLLSTTWAGEGGVIAAHEYDAGLATATAGEIVAAAE